MLALDEATANLDHASDDAIPNSSKSREVWVAAMAADGVPRFRADPGGRLARPATDPSARVRATCRHRAPVAGLRPNTHPLTPTPGGRAFEQETGKRVGVLTQSYVGEVLQYVLEENKWDVSGNVAARRQVQAEALAE